MKKKLQNVTDYNLLMRARFIASSLSNFNNNLSKVIHRLKCKYRHNDKKCETCLI